MSEDLTGVRFRGNSGAVWEVTGREEGEGDFWLTRCVAGARQFEAGDTGVCSPEGVRFGRLYPEAPALVITHAVVHSPRVVYIEGPRIPADPPPGLVHQVDRYVTRGRQLACVRCGFVNGLEQLGTPCIGDPGWRKASEESIAYDQGIRDVVAHARQPSPRFGGWPPTYSPGALVGGMRSWGR